MMAGSILSLCFFFALIAAIEFGRHLRRRSRGQTPDGSATGPADGVVFAIVGLLIAFTFTAAASRFDERRRLINEQANALGTAWLRTDLLQPQDRDQVRHLMREWTRLYIEKSASWIDPTDPAVVADLNHAQVLQNQTWQAAIHGLEAVKQPIYDNLVLPPINDWIDLSGTRYALATRGMPLLVILTLVVLSLACAILAGYSMGKQEKRSLLHTVLFCGSIAFSLYVITDLSHPRSGLIQIDSADIPMQQLYQSMNPTSPTSMP